jgi:mono/diheme cytochrome c family protein
MKLSISKIFASVTIFTVALCLVSFVSFNAGWDVPAADKAIKNPVKADATSIGEGKTLYTKTCKSCHGEKGIGVGKMAEPSNFTAKEFKAQSDGAIYFKINTGHGKMPAYKSKIKADNDRWNLVNYLRTL